MRRKRGSQIIQPCVVVRDGKPCCLKRHFRGVLRQILSYLDMLAANDPERFAWPEPKTIREHARKWKGGSASRSRVHACLTMAKEHGLIEEVERFRNGSMRAGFIVISHDDIAVRVKQTCTISAPKQDAQEDIDRTPDRTSAGHEKGQSAALDRTSDRTDSRTIESLQSADRTVVTRNEGAGLQAALHASLGGPNPENHVNPENSANSVNPSIPEIGGASFSGLEASRQEPLVAPVVAKQEVSSFGDLTVDPIEGQVKIITESLGDRLRLSGLTTPEIITAVSGGEFALEALNATRRGGKRYLHTGLLAQCCLAAAEEYETEPYEGRRSFAAVMGRAMELLRERYGFDAPRGWVPVMRTLREGGDVQNHQRQSNPYENTKPEMLFMYIDATVRHWCPGDDSLYKAAKADHELMAALIETAREHGVPGMPDGLVWFADAVIAKLRAARSQPVPALVAFREAMQARSRRAPLAQSAAG